ncbi:hypothetical protein J1614_003491 [Plenodomus biglobosus]|nr:hypothetical protein J1614_003491 [Plenodomus biglobosus]
MAPSAMTSSAHMSNLLSQSDDAFETTVEATHSHAVALLAFLIVARSALPKILDHLVSTAAQRHDWGCWLTVAAHG